MQFEEKIYIDAPVEKIFALYSDVKNWSTWDPDVKTASIEGAFVSGATGYLEPSNGPKAKIFFIHIVPNNSFVVESKLPLCVMRFEHELLSESGRTKVIHRIIFKGVFSIFFSHIIGSQIRKGLPMTLRGLKIAAEC